MAGPDDRRPVYSTARKAIAGAFALVVCIIVLWDAFSVDYSIEPIPFGMLLGIVAGLLGVAGFDRFMGSGGSGK